jgi:sortase A
MTALSRSSETPRTTLRAETLPAPAPEASVPAPAGASVGRLVVARVLIAVALLAGWTLAYLFVFSGLEQARSQQALYAQFRSQLAASLAPIEQPIAAGRPIAVLSFPAAGTNNVVVVEGTSSEQLQDGPGHLPGTVLPGDAGISVLMGRALSFGAPFADIAAAPVGAPITVTTGQGTFHYTVEDVRRRGDPLPAPLAAQQSRLTLVTATGSGFLGALTEGATVYVDAVLHGKAQQSYGTLTAGADTDAPLAADLSFGTLTELVLALQLLGVVLVGVTWARHRWRALPVWLVGAPAVLACLWAASGIATRLLPNLV